MGSVIARINARACILSWLIGVCAPLQAVDLHQYVSRSINLARYDVPGWKGPRPAIGEFYPLGFSADGWFAYVHNREGDRIEDQSESCEHPPCDDGVSITNITCNGECVSDTPQSADDKCWCPIDTRVRDLARFGIQPLKNVEHGSFPLRIDSEVYSIRMITKENLIPSEAMRFDPTTHKSIPEPGFPGIQIFLESLSKGKKLLRVFDPNHEGIAPGTLRPVAWLRELQNPQYVIVMAYISNGKPSSVIFVPIGTDLKSGFGAN